MIKDGQLHRTLYTYMPIDLLDELVKPVFEKCKLWLSFPTNFNAHFDCRIYPHIQSDDELAEHLATYAENATPSDYNIIRERIQKLGSVHIVKGPVFAGLFLYIEFNDVS